MGIVFFCQSCGARFEVDPRMAGKKGRCKKCGQGMEIPKAEQIASMMAVPALAASAVRGPTEPGGAGTSIGSWLREGAISQAGLAPLTQTVDRLPRFKKKPDALDDAEDSKPYVLAKPERTRGGRVKVQDNVVLRAWRNQLGGIIKIFRGINQTAYLISVPFLMILILGAVLKNRHMAMFGATVVVLLNIGRLVSGAVNLAIIPLRDGIDPKKMKKPMRRVIEPAITIVAVILAFVFIPWLSTGGAAKGNLADRIRAETKSLEGTVKGEVNKALDQARSIDVEKLSTQAQEKLKGLGIPTKGESSR